MGKTDRLKPMNMQKWLGHIAALFVVFVWGTTFVSSKVLLNEGLSPDEIFFLRGIIAYICLLTISHKRLCCSNWKDELAMFSLGITGSSFYFMMENTALMYSTSSNVSILVGSTPLLTALLVCALDTNENHTKRQSLGSLIAFLGMALVVLNGQLVLHLNPLGDTLAIMASLSWAVYSYLMRKVTGRYSSAFITRKVFFYGVITILPVLLIKGTPHLNATVFSDGIVLGNIIFLGFIASFIGFVLWSWVLSKIDTIKATNYVYLQSFITLIVASIVLKERITIMAVAGMIILVVGMVLAQKDKHIENFDK